MRQAFTIPGRLDGMNEYTAACRAHYRKGARMKRENQDAACAAIRAARLRPYEGAVTIRYTFYEKPKRPGARMRDKSNIASFAVKVIEDALQETGVIRDDGWDHLADWSCRFFRASGDPRIEVEIEEA